MTRALSIAARRLDARAWAALGLVATAAVGVVGCRDVSRFSTRDDHHYEGTIVQGSFVRAGLDADARMCLLLDADHLQDTPGSISTVDGRFRATALRPIPQIWHDPLSTLAFGDGRTRNLLYVAAAQAPVDGGAAGGSEEGDVMVFLSLMQSGDVEVRLLRGAPPASADVTGASDAGATTTSAATAPANLFGVFTLRREEGACSF